MIRLLIILALFINVSQAQTVRGPMIGRATASAVTKDTAFFAFSEGTGVGTITGWIKVTGNPGTGGSVRTATHGTNGIGVSSIATANWLQYNSGNVSPQNGENSAGCNSVVPATAMQEAWYTGYVAWNPSTSPAQFMFTGLSTSKSYTIILSASDKYTGTSGTDYYVKGNGALPTGPNYLLTGHNTANCANPFNGVVPNGSGQILVYVRASTVNSSPLGMIGTARIYEE